MKLNYVANLLNPSGKYCAHRKTTIKGAVDFYLVLKKEAGTTNYNVFSPSLYVRMKILSPESWSLGSKPSVPFEDFHSNLRRHTQDRTDLSWCGSELSVKSQQTWVWFLHGIPTDRERVHGRTEKKGGPLFLSSVGITGASREMEISTNNGR